MIYIVDASAALGWFLREEGVPDASFLLDRTIRRLAPDLIFSEAANVIQRKVRMGELSLEQADKALTTLEGAFDGILPSQALFRAAFDLSRKLDHSVYDCMYLAAAHATDGGILVTSDRKFLAKAQSAGENGRIHTLELAYAQFVSAQENRNG